MIYHHRQVPIFYEVHGQGPAVVLLHGFLESSTMWSKFVPEFSRSKTVIIIDLPGHGKSASIETVHSMGLMAEVVNALLVFLDVDVASLIGHSMGGYVSLAFTERYPKKVKTLVLLNSTTKADSPEVRLRRNRANALIDKDKAAVVNTTISNLFAKSSRHLLSREIEALKKEALTFSSEGIIAANLGMRDRKDRTHVLKNHGKPKYIICAEEDPIVPLEVSEEIARTTGSQLIVLAGGHMSWMEKEEEIVKIMLFIE